MSQIRKVIAGSNMRIAAFLAQEGFESIPGGWEFSPRTTKEPGFPTVIVYKADSDERTGTIQATTSSGAFHKTHFLDYPGFVQAYQFILDFLELNAGEKGMS